VADRLDEIKFQEKYFCDVINMLKEPHILKIWPTRAPIERQRPAEFNFMLDRLVSRHCGLE